MTYAFQAEGLVKRFGKTTALAGIDLAAQRGHRARRARAERRRQDHRRPHSRHPAPARRRPRHGRRVRRRDGRRQGSPHHRPHRAVRLGRRGPHRHGEPACSSGSCSTCAARDAKARAGELLEGFDLDRGRRPAGQDLLRRHAPAPRPRRQPCRPSRRSSSSTSRPPASTRPSAKTCGRRARRSSPTASTVLLTTQYLEEADALADEISVIDHGRVIAHGTPAELKQVVGGQTHRGAADRPGRLDRGGGDPPRPPVGTRRVGRRPRRARRSPVDDDTALPGGRPLDEAGGSVSPSCRCACPASTRSSSPSPATPTADDARQEVAA